MSIVVLIGKSHVTILNKGTVIKQEKLVFLTNLRNISQWKSRNLSTKNSIKSIYIFCLQVLYSKLEPSFAKSKLIPKVDSFLDLIPLGHWNWNWTKICRKHSVKFLETKTVFFCALFRNFCCQVSKECHLLKLVTFLNLISMKQIVTLFYSC